MGSQRTHLERGPFTKLGAASNRRCESTLTFHVRVVLRYLIPLGQFIFSRETAVYVSDPILGSFCTEDIDLPDGEFFFSCVPTSWLRP